MTVQLVCLHGFTGSGADWRSLAAELETNYQVFAPDIIGHGVTAKPDDVSQYVMARAAEHILAAADEKFHLLGYSMGGRLALYIATHYPERVQSLILESASPGLKTQAERAERQQRDDALADKIEANGIAWFVDFWEALPLWDSQTDEQKAYLREGRLRNNPLGLANSLRGMGTGVMPNLWDKLPELTLPTQLIVGELDTKFVKINQSMQDLLPDSTLTIVPAAGHTVHLEQRAAFIEIVHDFLAK